MFFKPHLPGSIPDLQEFPNLELATLVWTQKVDLMTVSIGFFNAWLMTLCQCVLLMALTFVCFKDWINLGIPFYNVEPLTKHAKNGGRMKVKESGVI